MKRWYSTKEAADFLGYNTTQVIPKLIKAGQLPAFQPGGSKGKLRIDGNALWEFVKSKTKNPHLLTQPE